MPKHPCLDEEGVEVGAYANCYDCKHWFDEEDGDEYFCNICEEGFFTNHIDGKCVPCGGDCKICSDEFECHECDMEEFEE